MRRDLAAAVMRFDAQIGPCGDRAAPRRPSRGDVDRAYGASPQNPLAPPESHDAGAAGILFREPEGAGRRVCTVWFWSATRIRVRRSRSSSSSMLSCRILTARRTRAPPKSGGKALEGIAIAVGREEGCNAPGARLGEHFD